MPCHLLVHPADFYWMRFMLETVLGGTDDKCETETVFSRMPVYLFPNGSTHVHYLQEFLPVSNF